MTWITIPQAMQLVGRSRATIYNWAHQGHIRTTRSSTNTLLIDAEHLINTEPTITRGRPTGTARPQTHHR